MIPKISVIMPYYKNRMMLMYQMYNFFTYPKEVLDQIEIIVVDDGTPEDCHPAYNVLRIIDTSKINLSLYRVTVDVPWAYRMARNLGAHHAKADWLFMLDIDHTIPVETMTHVSELRKRPHRYYTFRRHSCKHLHPPVLREVASHNLTMVIAKEKYWEVGGNDEDFDGHYGLASSWFLHRAQGVVKKVLLKDCFVHAHINSAIPEAQGGDLARDAKHNTHLYNKKVSGEIPISRNYLRLPWEKVI